MACISDIGIPEEEEKSQDEEMVPEGGATKEEEEETEGEKTEVNPSVKNGDFERWLSEVPYSFFYNNTSVKRENKIVYAGGFSARMYASKGTTAKLYQRIAIASNHRLRIRFHYYIEQWKKNGARMYCYFRTTSTKNIPNTDLNEIYDKETLKIIRGGGYGLSYFPEELAVWQTFDYTITSPSTANYFVFEIHSYHGTTIYIDDCSVVDLDWEEPFNQNQLSIK